MTRAGPTPRACTGRRGGHGAAAVGERRHVGGGEAAVGRREDNMAGSEAAVLDLEAQERLGAFATRDDASALRAVSARDPHELRGGDKVTFLLRPR